MKPLTHIVAATDLSSASMHAVDRGFLLAKATGAQLTVIHALCLDALAPLTGLLGENTAMFTRQLSDAAHEALQQVIDDPVRNQGITAKLQIEQGQPLPAIAAHAEATHTGLIAVGAHGKGFLQRVLLGSTASRLLRKSHCPVLVVKEPARYDYRRVLAAVDFSSACGPALKAARACAPRADVLALNVVELPFEGKLHIAGISNQDLQRYRDQARACAESQLRDFLVTVARLGSAPYRVRVVYGEVARQILIQEEASDCDLIVVGKHGTHVTEDLLLGSVTNHVLAESRADVLVVTAPSLSGA